MKFESEYKEPTPSRRVMYREVDHIITQRRKEEQERNFMDRQNRYYKIMSKKADFERATVDANDRYRLMKSYQELKQIQDEQFSNRKQKLAQLLENDSREWAIALNEARETTFDRVENMKAEIEALRKKRMQKEKCKVDDLMFAQWKKNCHDLRGFESKLREKETASALEQQMAQKELSRKATMEETKLWDKIYERERLKKVEKYENEERIRRSQGLFIKNCLEIQIKEINERREEEKRLKDDENEFMKQKMMMLKLEDERNALLKRQETINMCQELDRFTNEAMKRKAEAIQRELEMDMEILKEVKKIDDEEKIQQNRRKKELRNEIELFHKHILRQKSIENERQKEIEKAYLDENIRQNRITYEKWKKEQDARDNLMKEVIATRNEQIQEKINCNKIQQEENKRELQKLLEKVKEYQEEEKIKKQKAQENKIQYANDLFDQISHHSENYQKLCEQKRNQEIMDKKRQKEFDDLLEKTKILEELKTKLKISEIKKEDISQYGSHPNPALYNTYTQDRLHNSLLLRESSFTN